MNLELLNLPYRSENMNLLGKEPVMSTQMFPLANKDNEHCPCLQGLKLKYVAISPKSLFEKSGLTRKRYLVKDSSKFTLLIYF
jgi:hypothetical protein